MKLNARHFGSMMESAHEHPLGTEAQGSSILGIKDEPWCEGSNTAAFHQLRQNAADACRVATRREQLELVAGLAEA